MFTCIFYYLLNTHSDSDLRDNTTEKITTNARLNVVYLKCSNVNNEKRDWMEEVETCG